MSQKLKSLDDKLEKLLKEKETLIKSRQSEILKIIEGALPALDIHHLKDDVLIGALLDIKNTPEKQEAWSKTGRTFRRKLGL
jgi:hypothetical protein